MENESGHMDPTLEISLETVKSKAVKGVIALTGRTLILRVISFVAQGLLWAFLEPEHFGAFLLVSATVNFLSYFADIGLGAALIQKKEKPTQEDFRTVFTVQEILVVSISAILLLFSPVLVRTHNLSQDGLHLLYALTIAFFLASLKNIPSIILERKLEFGKFIIPQVLEDLVYNVVVVYLAWKGLGLASFTWAVLARGVIGVIAIYILQPWKPGIAFSKKSLKNLLGFGIPYQINNFLATVKDDGLTIVLGGILGSAGLGILGVAQRASQYPLRFFMDTVTKVTFPAFSRMQDDKEQLERGVTRSVFFICALVFPSLVGLVILFPAIIELIPRYQKWEPAYIPLIFFSANAAIGAFTTQFTNTFNAIGKIKMTFKLMVMWTALSWLLVPFLGIKSGFVGASFGYFIVSASSIVAYFMLKKYVKIDAFYSLVKPFIASFVMGTVLFLSQNYVESMNYVKFGFIVFSGVITYGLSLYLLIGKVLLEDVKKTFSNIFKR
jgi:PST family polysaccharide transporter